MNENDLARLSDHLEDIEAALSVGFVVASLMRAESVAEDDDSCVALDFAMSQGDRALRKARRRLARLREASAPVAV